MANWVIRLTVVALFFPMAAAAQAPLKKNYTDQELVEILSNEGYRAVEISGERRITIKVDGLTYTLYVFDDDDLQLVFGMTGYKVTHKDMSEWNRTKRLSRAYLDLEDDPIVEADLLANAGYTEEQFLEWVDVFNIVAREFRRYLDEQDQSE